MIEQHTPTSVATLPSLDQTVTIRPLSERDYDALLSFGMALPENDWVYLEDDLQNSDTIRRLINAHAAENWRQVVAVVGGAIIGYSSVRRLPGWSSHVADIVLVVAEGWRRHGVGTALARSAFAAARELKAEKVIVEILEAQTSGRAIFERLGFRVEGTLSDYARDHRGRRHNLHILAYHV